jgi:hypothetical protein
MKETNMEHYRNKMTEMLENKIPFAVIDGELSTCEKVGCDHCDLRKEIYCADGIVAWMMAEYKEKPTLTAREKHFVEFAETGWLVRDESGNLDWCSHKPYKNHQYKSWDVALYATLIEPLQELFAFITWEDEEPWSVEDLRKLKVLEYNPDDVAFKGGELND